MFLMAENVSGDLFQHLGLFKQRANGLADAMEHLVTALESHGGLQPAKTPAKGFAMFTTRVNVQVGDYVVIGTTSSNSGQHRDQHRAHWYLTIRSLDFSPIEVDDLLHEIEVCSLQRSQFFDPSAGVHAERDEQRKLRVSFGKRRMQESDKLLWGERQNGSLFGR